MPWILPTVGVIAGSMATYGLWSLLRPRSALVLYSDDPGDTSADRGTFRAAGQRAARYLHTTAVGVSSAQDILDAIDQAPGNLGVVMLVGHGTPQKFFSPSRFGIRHRGVGRTQLPRWISAADFSVRLAPKLARGFILTFAGCSAGRNSGEPSGWVLSSTSWDGGAQSLAARLRDSLARSRATGEVRGHTVFGTALDNPQGRTFYAGRGSIGRPGVHIMHQAGWSHPQDFNDYRAWNTYAQGRIARGWMVGLPIPRGRPSSTTQG